jgi:hypothetical protein
VFEIGANQIGLLITEIAIKSRESLANLYQPLLQQIISCTFKGEALNHFAKKPSTVRFNINEASIRAQNTLPSFSGGSWRCLVVRTAEVRRGLAAGTDAGD